MDMLVILIAVSFLVHFDIILFRRMNRNLTDEVFGSQSGRWILLFLLPVFVLTLQSSFGISEGEMTSQTNMLYIVILGFYLFKRKKFIRVQESFTPDEDNEPPGPAVESAGADRLKMISQATGLIFEWMLGVLIFTLSLDLLSPLVPLVRSELGQIILTAVFSSFFMVGLIKKTTEKPPYPGFVRTVALRRGGASLFKLVFIPTLVGINLAIVSSFLMVTRPVTPSTPLSEILLSAHSSWLVMGFLVLAILMAPLLEEVIFRGYYFHVIREFKGRRFAVIFIALVFSFLHVGQYWGDWLAIAVVTVLGFVLTGLRVWSGSTISSVIAHYIYNGLVTFIPVLLMLGANSPYIKYQMLYSQLDAPAKEALLKATIKDKKDFAPAYNDLAWLYAEEQKNLDEALALTEKAIALDPEEGAYLDTRAEVLFRSGKVEEAIAIEEKLVRENPRDGQFKEQLEKFRAGGRKENFSK